MRNIIRVSLLGLLVTTSTVGAARIAQAQDAEGSPVCASPAVRGGELVYARANETVSLNPMQLRNGNGDIFADAMIYQGLVQYDPSGKPNVEPAIAESWSVSPDGLKYTFKLRDGVKFSNGQPVTAEDVKFSLDRFGDTKINEGMGAIAVGYKSSQIIDAKTVEITLSKPVAAFLHNIAIFPAFIVPMNLVKEQGDKFWQNPIGSGPFMVKEFVSGSHLTFARNPYYWDAEKPLLDSVTFSFASDANSRLLALMSGSAHIADTITPSQIESVTSNPDVKLQSVKIPGWITLFPNVNYEPLKDRNVRLAIASAIDRELISKAIFHGLASIPNSIFGEFNSLNDEKGPKYAYDLEKAKEYLAQSAFPDGFDVTLEYPSGSDYYKQLGLLLQNSLGEIGIRVQLQEVATATMTANFTSQKYQLSFGFPQVTSDIALPDEFASFMADPNSGTDGFFTGWSDADLASKVEKFVTETNLSSREQQWPEIQASFMAQQPAINIVNLPILNAHRSTVCGTDVNILGIDQLQNTWLGAK